MGDFEIHSFCPECGHHRRRMPFGRRSGFFDRGPCEKCGAPPPPYGTSHQRTARNVRVGRWPWQRGWVDRDGNRVDSARASEGSTDG